jgi:hypothetical protein
VAGLHLDFLFTGKFGTSSTTSRECISNAIAGNHKSRITEDGTDSGIYCTGASFLE